MRIVHSCVHSWTMDLFVLACLLTSIVTVVTAVPIVHGIVAPITRVPWQLSLWRRRYPDNNPDNNLGKWRPICGATLISERWAISAFHCFNDPAYYDYPTANIAKVKAGITHLSEPGIEARVEKIFRPQKAPGDFALLKLNQPIFNSGDMIRSIGIASPSRDYGGMMGYISGWGRIENDVRTQTLRSAQMRVLASNDPLCAYFQRQMPAVCVLSLNPHPRMTTAALGDSGGPLVIYLKDEPFLLGAASRIYVEDRGQQRRVNGYIYVPFYLDFIERTVSNNNDWPWIPFAQETNSTNSNDEHDRPTD